MNFSEILNFSSRDKKNKSLKKSGKFIEPFRSGPGWVNWELSVANVE
jgi:hypothetical protein